MSEDSKKMRFEDWDVLPMEIGKQAGKRLDKELKKRVKKAIDELYLGGGFSLHSYSNNLFLEWLKGLTEKGPLFYLEVDGVDNSVKIECSFIPDDFDEDFTVSIDLEDLIRPIVKEKDDEEYTRIRARTIAAAFRRAADTLEQAGKEPTK